MRPTRPPERAWLLALGLILGSTGAALAGPVPPAGPAPLRPFDERTLGIGESHDYHFALKKGEYLRIDVEQNDSIDAGIKLFDAGGRLLTESNSYTDIHGAETLSWIAERDEDLRVQVYVYENRAGRYHFGVDGPREPVAYDRERALACRAFNEGFRLERTQPNGLLWLAEQSYREALERWSQLAEPRWTAISRWTLAFTLYRQGRSREEIRLLREVWPDLLRLEERNLLVHASLNLLRQEKSGSTLESERFLLIGAQFLPTLHPEATAFFASGYKDKAWSIGEVGFAALFARYEVAALRATRNRDRLPAALASLSRLMRRIGRFGEAREVAEELRLLAKSSEEKVQASIALGHCALAAHEPQKALAELRPAEALAKSREAEAELAYYLGWALYEAASYAEAAEQLRRAAAIQESGMLATSLAFLSLTELRLGHLEAAKSNLRRAVTTPQDPNFEVEAFLHRVEADIARVEGRWNEARSALSETLRMLGERRETGIIGASYWSARTDYIEFAVELLTDLAEGDAERDLERSFLVLDASRAPFLVSMLAEGNGARTGSDPLTRNALHQIDDQIAMLQKTRPPSDWKKKVSALQEYRDDLLLDASLKEIITARKSSSRPRPSLDNLRRQLAPDEQLVSFLLGQERSYAWLLDHRQLRIAILPAKSVLEPMIVKAVEALEASREPGRLERVREPFAEISKSLLGALGPFLDGRRLLLNLDGALHRLPFSVLTDPVSGEGILLEKFELVVVPSLTLLWITRRDRRPCSGTSVLSIDDALISTQRDIEAVRRFQPDAQTTGLTRRELFTGAIQDKCLVHFATHSTAPPEWPDTGWLQIGRTGSAPERLYAFEIETLKLKADLVVLASCSSGLGELRGEGLYGLPRAFLAAGAKGVLASLWKVDGKATSELMDAFYRNLDAGHEPSSALRLAQLSLRARPERAAPAFWAAFQLIGDPQGVK